MNYKQAEKILGEQLISQELLDSVLRPIIKESDSLFKMVSNAYSLGVINGKQAERARRAQR